jgi:hypothetical protein
VLPNTNRLMGVDPVFSCVKNGVCSASVNAAVGMLGTVIILSL